MVERPRFARFGYVEGECSKAVEVVDSSRKKFNPFKQKDGTSLSRSDTSGKGSWRNLKSPRRTPQMYKKHDYSNVSLHCNHRTDNMWKVYPCTLCGLHNHCLAKCWKRKSLHNKFFSNSKEMKYEDHHPCHKMEKEKKDMKS